MSTSALETTAKTVGQTVPCAAASRQGRRGLFGRLVELGDAFFFRPTDPATIGLLRICCGLLVFYVHLLYTVDLYKICGKDAWLGLEFANLTRLQSPARLMAADFKPPPPHLPVVDPEERLKVQEWLTKFGIDPRTLPQDFVERATIEDCIANFGSDPRTAYAIGSPTWSIWFHLTEPSWMMVAHIAILVCMFLFLIGFCSRLTAALTWFGALCFIHRAPVIMFGQDAMLNLALAYLTLAPCGAAFSIDQLIRRWRLRRCYPNAGNALSRPVPSTSANFAIRLFQMHFCIIYFASGTAKLQGATWWSGTAIWSTLANADFAPLDNSFYLGLLRFLCAQRWLWETVNGGGSIFTVMLELGFPFLIWFCILGDLLLDVYGSRGTPTPLESNLRYWIALFRWLLIFGVILLHVGIMMIMNLLVFSLFMILLALPYMPPAVVRSFVASLTRLLCRPFSITAAHAKQ